MLEVESVHACGKSLDRVFLLKPIAVAEVKFESERLHFIGFEIFRLEVTLDRVFVRRIIMPITGRAKNHVLRHMGFPKLHRLANDDVFDTCTSRMSRHGQPKGSRADDEQRKMFCHKASNRYYLVCPAGSSGFP